MNPDLTQAPGIVPLDRSLLPRALVRLILLRYRGVARKLFRGSAKRRAFTLVGFGLMAMYILPALLASQPQSPASPEKIRLWLPIGLVAFVLLQMLVHTRRDPMTFQPAELDLVVPGPYSRRQLILYQLAYQVGPIILMGLWLALFIRAGGIYPARAVGAALIGQLIMLLASVTSSALGIIITRFRWALLVPPAAAALIVLQVVRTSPPWPGVDPARLLEWVTAIRHLPIIEAICLPFLPYSTLFTSTTLFEAIPSACLALLMNLALAALFIRLDRGEVESLVIKSQQRLEQHRKMRLGGFGLANAHVAAGRTIPRPPLMGGAGPLMWRQLTAVYRGGGPLIAGIIVVSALGAGGLFGHLAAISNLLPALPYLSLIVNIVLTMFLRCDFRADLDHIPLFKTLPIPPRTMVLGQIAAPLVLIAIIQLLLATGVLIGSSNPGIALKAIGLAALSVPFAAALLAIDNTVFLIAPLKSMKNAAPAGFDPSLVGRHFLVTMIKLVLFAAMTALAGGPAGLILWLGGPVPLAVAAGLAVTLAILYGLITCCAAAFKSFNVVDDQPA